MKEYTVQVHADGTTLWYLNGELHRDNGPAVESTDGYKEWYHNGKYHREDGPAYESEDGHKEWHLNGVEYTEEEYMAKISKA